MRNSGRYIGQCGPHALAAQPLARRRPRNGVAYVVDRTNLGAIGKGDGTTGEGVASAKISSTQIVNGAAAYRTPQAAYVATLGKRHRVSRRGRRSDRHQGQRDGSASDLGRVVRLPGVERLANGDHHRRALGRDRVGIGAGSSHRMFGFDGDTGQVIFAGGGPDDAMSSVRGMATAIAAKGRIFVPADAGVLPSRLDGVDAVNPY